MRRRGRECALQILYQLDAAGHLGADDVSPDAEIRAALDAYWESFETVKPKAREFSERLVRGVIQSLSELDELISSQSQNWKVERMDRVDLNLLRLAAYEIVYCADIPKAATINEALEIAKRFSEHDAGPFINGILDRIGE